MENAANALPELSERMMAIVKMVTKGNRLADIGCDHGYISIWLYKNGLCPTCIASDVNEGPLKGAEKNIELFGASAGVKVRLSDGLSAFKEGEADTILITGMGGGLIERILSDRENVVLRAREVIAEPQSDPQKVRQCLARLGFTITAEDFVKECGKYYPVIKAEKRSDRRALSETEARFGPCLIKGKNPLFREFLLREEKRYESILLGLKKKNPDSERSREIREEIELIKGLISDKEKMTGISKVILASGSPRRRELLKNIGIEPVVQPSNAPEDTDEKDPAKVVEVLSERKCLDVAGKVSEGVVVAADTVVSYGGNILGKPADKEEAYRMIDMLQGNVHQVYTGVTVCSVKKEKVEKKLTFFEKTDVTVETMTEEEINRYIETGESMDKAGAYGIQGYFSKHISKIDGDYFNVVGLPVAALYKSLKEL